MKNVGCFWRACTKGTEINGATPGVHLDFERKTAEITRLFEAETSCESYELLSQTQRDEEEQGEKERYSLI